MTRFDKWIIFLLYLNAFVWTILSTSGEVSDATYVWFVTGPAAVVVADGFFRLVREIRAGL
jgi:hypothetical protein